MKVRKITTYEGMFVSVNDLKATLEDPQMVLNCASMLIVGQRKGRPIEEVIRNTLALPLAEACGVGKPGEVLAERKFWFTDGDGI